jgi:hypothetical protein
LSTETRQLHLRLDDLEAAVYNRPVGAHRAAHGAGASAAFRSRRPVRASSNSIPERALGAPVRLVDAAAVLLRGISVGVARQADLGFEVVGSFADAILGRRPIDRFSSQRSRRPETSGPLGRGRWLE